MKITDLIFEIVLDEAKGKDLFASLISKWKTQSPKFNALDDTEQLRVGEYIFNFYMKIIVLTCHFDLFLLTPRYIDPLKASLPNFL